MASRKFFNWTAEDVVRFLKNYDFQYSRAKGSHIFYKGYYGKEKRQVCIPFHGSKTIRPKTFKSIIKQSGIPKEKWLGK